jgi:hypothetical protein
LVAPVALYPDVVLASLLPATTYPEQLRDAASWVGEREAPIDAVPEDRNWDGSVSGLLQFPDVLRWADENDAWTDEAYPPAPRSVGCRRERACQRKVETSASLPSRNVRF